MTERAGGGGEEQQRPGIVHRALMHPTRFDILVQLKKHGRLSPARYSECKGVSPSVSAYHFKVLHQHEAIELVGARPERGSAEHFYSIHPQAPLEGVPPPETAGEEQRGGEERPDASN
jgi:DNA-binding transcriptional ArsR family regulator